MADGKGVGLHVSNHEENSLNCLDKIEDIGYDEFFIRFMLPNRLCVFTKEVTKSWKSRYEWVENGKPNLRFLSERFGNALVPVANCGSEKFGSHEKQNMKFQEFLDYWQEQVQSRDKRCLYLKDWHFCKEFPEYEAYKVPPCFTSDWLNEYWDQKNDDNVDDYRFVYMGPKGSWTPFHADVFRSYSWSANICGCKKWIIYPPGEERYLCDRFGNLPYDITSEEMCNTEKFPHYSKASEPIVVLQQEGEVIFVPSGWHHQVINLEDTISINHNWINSCGLLKMWQHLQSELKLVERSIDDCRSMDGWYEQCQIILKASSGIDYKEFLRFMEAVANRRICFLEIMYCNHKENNALSRHVHNSDNDDQCFSTDGRTHTEQTKTPDHKIITRIKNSTSLGSPVLEKYVSDSEGSLNDVFQNWLNTIQSVASREKYNDLDYCRFDLQTIVSCIEELKKDDRVEKLEDGTHVKIVSELLAKCCEALTKAKRAFGVLDLKNK